MATKTKSSTSAKTGAKAPAKKTTAKKASDSSATKKTVARKSVKSTAKVTPVEKKTPAKKATTKTTAAKKTTSSASVRLVVKYDAGFGNKLYIRGNAPGLTWDQGVELENVASDEWVWKSKRTTKSYEVKVLVNDNCWDVGENLIIGSKKITHTPNFG